MVNVFIIYNGQYIITYTYHVYMDENGKHQVSEYSLRFPFESDLFD